MILKKNVIAFIVISVLGTLSHFVYEWSGENKIIGYFFSINESTWEHLKLLFFPTIIYSVFEYIFTKEKTESYIPSVVISLIYGMLSIVTLFYTISGVIGYNIDFINIAIYYIGVLIMIYSKNKLLKNKKLCLSIAFWFSLHIGITIALLFIFWTYNPPSLGIFTPPVLN